MYQLVQIRSLVLKCYGIRSIASISSNHVDAMPAVYQAICKISVLGACSDWRGVSDPQSSEVVGGPTKSLVFSGFETCVASGANSQPDPTNLQLSEPCGEVGMMTFALARESKWSEGLEEALGRQNKQFYCVLGACSDGVSVSRAQSS